MGRSIRVRPGGCDLLCVFQPLVDLLQLLTADRGLDLRPHHLLLVSDVIPTRLDELPQLFVIVGVAGLAVFEPLQQLLAGLFLLDRLVGERIAERFADRGPEVLLFDRFVLRLGG